jgi:hypothetical protein
MENGQGRLVNIHLDRRLTSTLTRTLLGRKTSALFMGVPRNQNASRSTRSLNESA